MYRFRSQHLLAGLLIVSTAAAQTFEELAKKAGQARESGRLIESIEFYRQALERKSSWPEGWWYLGTIFYDLDQYPEARDAFRKFLMLERESGPGWAMVGLCEYRTREYDQALHSLKRARILGLAGNDQLAYVASYHLALLLNRYEEFEFSFSVLFPLAREHFNNPRIVEALGLAVLRLPFLPEELPPDRREMVLLAGKAAAHGASMQAEAARRHYEELATRYPNTPNVHYALGVFFLQEDPERALQEFRRELELSPFHVPAHLQLAFEYLRRAKPQAGLPYARKAVELDPKSFAARNALGRVLLELNEVKEAIQELGMGARLAPDSPEMHFALARAYARAGRSEDAERARQEFLRLNQIVRAQREGPQAVGGIPLPPPQEQQ